MIMDAAQLIRKIALCFAVALLLAGAASAATLVASSTNVQFVQFGTQDITIEVTSGGSATNFTIGPHAAWYTVSPTTGLTTPKTLTIHRASECGGAFGPC